MSARSFRALSTLALLGIAATFGCSDSSEPAAGERSSQVIEPTGGSLSAAGATVTVPGGSILEAAELTLASVEVASLGAPAPSGNSGSAFVLTPYGMSFAQEVQVTIPAPLGATEVLRADDDIDPTWEGVTAPVFAETTASFGTFATGVFVAVASSDVAADGTGGTTATPIAATGGATSATGGATSATGGATSATGGATSATGGTTSSSDCGAALLEVSETCTSCIDAACCSQKAACMADWACENYATCRFAGSGKPASTCYAEVADSPSAEELATSLDACVMGPDACGSTCPYSATE